MSHWLSQRQAAPGIIFHQPRRYCMRRVYWTILVLLASACLAQTQQPNQLASASGVAMQEPATGEQGRAAVATGERTIVGCVAIAAPGPGYVLNTADGKAFQLRGATDLSPYIGKKVQIHASWTSKGIHVAAPMESGEAAPAAAGAGGTPTSQEFAGSLQLQFRGKVLGDCLGKKK
jgi:hypothetical protein